jgi:hypothetical protein
VEVTICKYFDFFLFSHGVRLNPLGIAATVLAYYTTLDDDDDDDDDCGAIGGMRLGRGNRSTR